MPVIRSEAVDDLAGSDQPEPVVGDAYMQTGGDHGGADHDSVASVSDSPEANEGPGVPWGVNQPGDAGDLYRVLGVDPSASKSELRRAFRRAARATHPDVGGRGGVFERIRSAYEVLADPSRRRRYDERRRAKTVGGHTSGYNGAGGLVGEQPNQTEPVCVVPDVTGLSQDQAASVLMGRGFDLEVEAADLQPGDRREHSVIGQRPAAESLVAPGAAVVITVGRCAAGSATATLPTGRSAALPPSPSTARKSLAARVRKASVLGASEPSRRGRAAGRRRSGRGGVG